MEYLLCILPIALIAWLIIDDIANDRRKARRYQEYINSIRVGDIFEPNFVEDLNLDPFDEIIDYTDYSKIIIDIKKNRIGETWVKYKYKRQNDNFEYTQDIHIFVENHKRVQQSEI